MGQWEILIQGQRYVADTETIRGWILEQRVKKFDQMRRHANENWTYADKFPEFADTFSQALPINHPPANSGPPMFQPPAPSSPPFPQPYPPPYQPQSAPPPGQFPPTHHPPPPAMPGFAPPAASGFPPHQTARPIPVPPARHAGPPPKSARSSMGIGSFLAIALGVVVLAGLAVGAIAYFGPWKSAHGSEPMVVTNFFGKDGEITCAQITVPAGWRIEKNLNKDAGIQVGNRLQMSYAIIISDEKDLNAIGTTKDIGDLELSQYADLVQTPLRSGSREFSQTEESETTINGLKTFRRSFKLTQKDGFRARMTLCVVAGRHHYHQLLVWTAENRQERQKAVLEGIIGSFRELTREDFKQSIRVVATTSKGPHDYIFVSNGEPIRHTFPADKATRSALGDLYPVEARSPAQFIVNGRPFTFDGEGLSGQGRFWSNEATTSYTVVNLDDPAGK